MQIELPFAGVPRTTPALVDNDKNAKILETTKGALDSPRRNLALISEKPDGWESLGAVLGRVVSQCDRNRLGRRATELDLVA